MTYKLGIVLEAIAVLLVVFALVVVSSTGYAVP